MYLIAMHIFMHNPGGSGLSLPFNQALWIPFSFAIGSGLLEICRQGYWRYSKLTIILLGSCVLMTIPIAYPQSIVHLAIPRLTALWAAWLLFVSLQQFSFHQKQRQRLLWFILIGVLIEAIFGWVQFLLLEPGNPIGYNTIRNRPYGIFQQPNVMASFMATGIALSAYMLAREPMYRGKWNWKHFFILVIPALTIPIIVAIDSRTGKLSALLSIVLILPFLLKYASKKQCRLWCLMLILGSAIAWNWTQTYDWQPKELSFTIEGERNGFYPQVLYLFTKHPLLGVGYSNFESSYVQSAAQQYSSGVSNFLPMRGLDHPHNELLYWATEGGILPLIGLLIAASAVFLSVMKAKKGTRIAIIALFLPITLHSQLEYPFYHSLIHFITFIIFIFWTDQLTAKYKKIELSKTLVLRISALFLPAFATVFIVTGLHSGHWLNKFERTHPREPEYLMNVSNPLIWQSRFDWNLFTTELEFGVATNDEDMVKSYLSWAHQHATVSPRPSLYQNMAIAYASLDDETKSKQILEEAAFLFPNHDFSTPSYRPKTSRSSGSAVISEAQ